MKLLRIALPGNGPGAGLSGHWVDLSGFNLLLEPLGIIHYLVMGVSRGKMPLESNGVGINSRRLPAESVVSAFQHITYTTHYLISF